MIEINKNDVTRLIYSNQRQQKTTGLAREDYWTVTMSVNFKQYDELIADAIKTARNNLQIRVDREIKACAVCLVSGEELKFEPCQQVVNYLDSQGIFIKTNAGSTFGIPTLRNK